MCSCQVKKVTPNYPKLEKKEKAKSKTGGNSRVPGEMVGRSEVSSPEDPCKSGSHRLNSTETCSVSRLSVQGEQRTNKTHPEIYNKSSGHISAWATSLMEAFELKFNLLSDHVAYLPPKSANPMVPTQTGLH